MFPRRQKWINTNNDDNNNDDDDDNDNTNNNNGCYNANMINSSWASIH